MPYPNPPSTEKTSRMGLQAAGPQAFSVDVTVAISAEREQVFVSVVTQSASRANVVDMKTI